eukprot:gene356-6770_t
MENDDKKVKQKERNCRRHMIKYLNCISVANNWNHMVEEEKFPVCRENLTKFKNCLNKNHKEHDFHDELKEKMDKMPWEYKEDYVKKLFEEFQSLIVELRSKKYTLVEQ